MSFKQYINNINSEAATASNKHYSYTLLYVQDVSTLLTSAEKSSSVSNLYKTVYVARLSVFKGEGENYLDSDLELC